MLTVTPRVAPLKHDGHTSAGQLTYQYVNNGSLAYCFSELNVDESFTHNPLLDIKYEPHICKKSPEIWQISLFKSKHLLFRYFWKLQEEQVVGSKRM